MNTILLILLLVAGALIIGLAIALVRAKRDKKQTIRQHFLTKENADLKYSITVLTEIREGRLARAVELLEDSADTNALLFGTRLRGAHPITQDGGVNVLQYFKEYRDRFPRAPSDGADDQKTREKIVNLFRDLGSLKAC
jgi:hypothetical protein